MPSASTCPERRRARTAGWAAAVAVACAIGATVVAAPQDVFRSGTDLVVLQVTVVDQRGHYVPTLQLADFAVFDEGMPQTVTVFESADSPLDLMLLLDTSASMFDRIRMAQQAAASLVQSLRPDDRASIVLFSDRVSIAQSLTSDRAALEGAIGRARTGGGTALNEALYIALRELETGRRRQQTLRRQALVVLSDGADTSSRLSFDDVLTQARSGGVTVFTIYPASPFDRLLDPMPRRPGSGPFEMRQLADETGGRAFAPPRGEDIAGIYSEIGEELGGQYWLAYAPTATSAGFRRVSVRIVDRPELRARTRSGYYGAARPHRAGNPRSEQ
jgi:Ca-activated chloride channel homolog